MERHIIATTMELFLFFLKRTAFADKTKPSFRVLMGIFSSMVRVKK